LLGCEAVFFVLVFVFGGYFLGFASFTAFEWGWSFFGGACLAGCLGA